MASTYELLMKIGGKMDSSYSSVLSKATSKLSSLSKVTKPVTSGLGSIGSKLVGIAGGVVAGITLDSVAAAADSASKSTAQMEAVLKSTKGTAGMTEQQLNALAASQANLTDYSKGTTKSAENMILTFTNIKSNVFPQTLQATEDMATAMHTDATSAALQLGKALNDPATGYSRLQRVGVTFTASQIKSIKAMEKAGNTAGAQQVMLAELEKEFGGSAAAAASTIPGQITKAKNSLMVAAATAFSALMPIINSLMPSIVSGVQKISSFIQSHMPQISGTISLVVGIIKNILGTVSPFVKPILGDIKQIATNFMPSLGKSSGNLQGEVSGLVKGGLTVLKSVLDWIAQHGTLVKGALTTVAGGILALKAANTVTGTVKGVSDAFKNIKSTAKIAKGGFETARIAGMLFSDKLRSGFETVALKGMYCGDKIKAFGSGTLSVAKSAGKLTLSLGKTAISFAKSGAQAALSAAKFVIQKGATLASAAASKIAAAGQWVLNAAMSANPITLIIIAIVALVAAFVLLWTKCKGFRDFWTGMFKDISAGFKSFINLIIGGLNTLIGGLDAFKVTLPGWMPVVGGKSLGFSIPQIPQMANGGIVKHRSGGILANIGEGNYDEAVVPLKGGSSGGGGNYNINLNAYITIQGNASKSDITGAFDESMPKFKAMLKQCLSEMARRSPSGKPVLP